MLECSPERQVTWRIARRGGQIKVVPDRACKAVSKQLEEVKAQICAVVEFPFRVVKDLFCHLVGECLYGSADLLAAGANYCVVRCLVSTPIYMICIVFLRMAPCVSSRSPNKSALP